MHFITYLVTLFPTVLSLFTEDDKFLESLCSPSFCGEINPSLALLIFSKSEKRSTGESENCLKYDSHIKVGQSLVWLWRRARKVKKVGISLTFICRLLLWKKNKKCWCETYYHFFKLCQEFSNENNFRIYIYSKNKSKDLETQKQCTQSYNSLIMMDLDVLTY